MGCKMGPGQHEYTGFFDFLGFAGRSSENPALEVGYAAVNQALPQKPLTTESELARLPASDSLGAFSLLRLPDRAEALRAVSSVG